MASLVLSQRVSRFILDKVDWSNKKESNTGNRSAATVEGKESVAMAIGYESKAKGALGCWLVLAEWEKTDDGYHIKDVQSVRVDGEKIKASTWYILKDGKFIESEV